MTATLARVGTSRWHTCAAAAVCTVPIIIAFLIFQRRITEGIAMTGIKG